MPEVQASIVIHATPARIWAVMMDLPAWPEWNSFVTSIAPQAPHTALAVGSQQTIQIVPDAAQPAAVETYANTVTELVPERRLVWEGALGAAWLLNVRHWCTLEPESSGADNAVDGERPAVRFAQGEQFLGILGPVVGLTGKMKQLQRGYDRMNQELKERAEKA